MLNNFSYDVFLSHSSKDIVRVRKLAERLRASGLKVWFDEWIIKPGDDIYLAIEHGLQESRVQILCLSPASLGSEWVKLERSTAMFRDPTNLGRRFIPVILSDCDLPDTLRRYRYVDYQKEGRAAFAELLTVCIPPNDIKISAARSLNQVGARKKVKKQSELLVTLERKLIGHKGWVWDVGISSDGTWVASSSVDRTVKIWELKTGKCLSTLGGHAGDVNCVAITPDGKEILSASDDQTIRIWDVHNRRLLTTLEGHNSRVLSAVFSDGYHFLSGGRDNNVRLWNIHSRQCERIYKGHTDEIWAVGVNKDGTQGITGGFDLDLRYWDLSTGVCLAILKGHTNVVNSIQFTPDEQYAISGSDDRTIKIWDLKRQTCIRTLVGHQRTVYGVSIFPQTSLIASTGFLDETIRLWDWRSGDCLQIIELKDHASPICVNFSSDGKYMIVGAADPDIVYIYRISKSIKTLKRFQI